MIDIHLHILPQVDDGAATVDEAIEMCRMAEKDGCEVLIATPHQRQDRWPNRNVASLRQRRDQLQQQLGQSPRVVLGAEIHVDSSFLDDLLAPERNGLLTLNDGRYLLLEFSRSGVMQNPETVVHEVLLSGYVPILAHPELIPQFAMNMPLVERLVDRGALLQFTAASLLGEFGRAAATSVRQFLNAGLAHFVASDGHGTRWRQPGLSQAHGHLTKHWNETTANRLIYDNPRRVVDNQEIEN